MKKIKLDKKKGILFWVTGLSGSGKTTISKKIKNSIFRRYGPTVVISGDNLRKIFNLNKFDKNSRLIIGKKYSNLCKFLTNQGMNVIFAVNGLIEELRKYNQKNITNYVEIYIETDIKKLVKYSSKKHYKKKLKFVWGIDIKPEFPKKPHIKIKNNFNRDMNNIKYEILKKLEIILSYK